MQDKVASWLELSNAESVDLSFVKMVTVWGGNLVM